MKKLTRLLALLLLAGLLFSNWHKARQLDKLTAKTATLPETTAAQVVVKANKLTAKVRQPDGSVKATVKYVPPEGSVEVVRPTQGAETIRVKRAGFTFRPAVQGLLGSDIKAGLGARLAYFDRYGAGVGLDQNAAPYVFADRRLDDFTGLLRNTTAGVFVGQGRVGMLIGVYL